MKLRLLRQPFIGPIEDLDVDPDGRTVGDILDSVSYRVPHGCDAAVTIDAVRIGLDEWDATIPSASSVVVVETLPLGGGGGGGKKVLGIVLSIAAIAAAFVLPGVGGAIGAAFGATIYGSLTVGAAVGLGLGLIAGLITRPPRPSLDQAMGVTSALGGSTSQTYRLDRVGNQLSPYEPIPRPIGTFVWTPPLLSPPWSRTVNNQQEIRVALCCGLGPLEIDNITIGDTPIDHFDHDIEVRPGEASDGPMRLYPSSMSEETYELELTFSGGAITRTSRQADEIEIDVAFPRMVAYSADGKARGRTVLIDVEFTEAGEDNWRAPVWVNSKDMKWQTPDLEDGVIRISTMSTSAVFITARFIAPGLGAYDVRLARITADTPSDRVFTNSFWTSLRSIRYGQPMALPGVATVSLRLNAGEGLSGSLQPIKLRTRAKLPIWDGLAWSPPQLTNNPAWAALHILRGPGNPRPATDDDINLPAFKAWAEACAERGLEANGVIDVTRTVLDAFNAVAEAGWGSHTFSGLKHSVVYDRPPQGPVQHFAPHNTLKDTFELEKLMPERPHGIKAAWVNADVNFVREERVVPAPGYSVDGSDGLPVATEFTARQYEFITSADQAWKAARREIGASIFRDRKLSLGTAMEHLVVGRGDTISVTRPEYGWGVASGRIIEATRQSATLSDEVPMLAGQTYYIGIRPPDAPAGDRQEIYVAKTWPEGRYTKIHWGDINGSPKAIAEEDVPAPGGLYQFGAVDMISTLWVVDGVKCNNDGTGTLTCYPEGGEVFDLIAGNIPAYNSGIPQRPISGTSKPPRPMVIDFVANETTGAQLTPEVWVQDAVLTVEAPTDPDWRSWSLVVDYGKELQFADGGVQRRVVRGTNVARISGMEEGATYFFRIWWITRLGTPGDLFIFNATIPGRRAPPPNVVRAEINSNHLVWLYPNPPADLAGFVIRYHEGENRHEATATRAHGRPIWPSPPFDLAGIPKGTITLFIRAVDTVGNESSVAAVVVKDLGDELVSNVVETASAHPAWPPALNVADGGAVQHIVGGVVDGGDLVGIDLTTAFGPDDAPFFGAPDDGFFTDAVPPAVAGGMFPDLIYQVAIVPSHTWLDSHLTLHRVMDAPQGYKTEYARFNSDPLFGDDLDPFFGADADLFLGESSEFFPWPGSLDVAGMVAIRTTLFGGRGMPKLSEFDLAFDVDDVLEEIPAFPVAASTGTRVTLTKTFQVIKNTRLTLLADGGTAITARVEDESPSLGPLIKTLSATGAAVTGTVSATVQGY